MADKRPIQNITVNGRVNAGPGDENDQSLQFQLNFGQTAVGGYTDYSLEFTIFQQANQFTVPESLHIDNSLNPNRVFVYVTGTNMSFPVPPYAAGTFPIVARADSQIYFTSTQSATMNGNPVSVSVFNYKIPLSVWNGFAPLVDGARVKLIGVDGLTDQSATNPIIVGGNNSGAPVSIAVDALGRVQVVGAAAGGTVYGPDANGTPPTQAPIFTAGFDGTNVRRFSVDTSGVQNVNVLTSALPTGAATQATLASFSAGMLLAQGSTTAGQAGPLLQAAVLTGNPGYTSGQTSPLSMTTVGELRVQAAPKDVVAGTGNTGFVIFGRATTTAPTYTTGQNNYLSLTLAGALRVDGSATTQPVSMVGNVTVDPVKPSTGAASTVAITNGTSVTALASNSSRRGATIYCDGGSGKLLLGATASATAFTLKLADGGYYEVPFGYTGAIAFFGDAAVGNLRVTELT